MAPSSLNEKFELTILSNLVYNETLGNIMQGNLDQLGAPEFSKEDHLYLFPSWLEHGSRINMSGKDRWTVSFNTSSCDPKTLPSDFVEKVWGKGHEG